VRETQVFEPVVCVRGELAVRKRQIESDIASLAQVKGDQATALGRVYLDELRTRLKEEQIAQRRWSVLQAGISLVAGALLTVAIRWFMDRRQAARTESDLVSRARAG
jgi:hypothetical protein